MPEKCTGRKITSLALSLRVKDNYPVSRLKVVRAQLLALARDWHDSGCYQIRFNRSGRATHVVHRSSGKEVAIPEEDSFHRKWLLDDNFLDLGAVVTSKTTKQRIVLATYFQDGEGPHQPLKSFDRCVDEANSQLENEASRTADTSVTTNAVSDAVQEHKREAARERAREMITKRRRTEKGSAFS